MLAPLNTSLYASCYMLLKWLSDNKKQTTEFHVRIPLFKKLLRRKEQSSSQFPFILVTTWLSTSQQSACLNSYFQVIPVHQIQQYYYKMFFRGIENLGDRNYYQKVSNLSLKQICLLCDIILTVTHNCSEIEVMYWPLSS